MNRLFLIILLAFLFFIFAQIVIKHNTDKTNEPDYTVLLKYDGFEIRSYPELFVATTKLATSGYDGNSSEGFRKIASYIFGGNDKNMKIAMTSPVLMDMKDSVEMSFIMPNNINEENAPTPLNENVLIEKRKSRTVAVLTFSGWANSKKIAEKEQELIKMLQKENINYSGNITYMGYNPPYQVIDRKNEVAIEVQI